MNTNIGAISWFVDADTSPAVDSINEMNKIIDKGVVKLTELDENSKKVAIGFAKTELALSDFSNEMRKAGNTISSNGVVLDKAGNVSEELTRKYAALRLEMQRLSPAARGVADGIGQSAAAINQNIRNIGYQITDIGVQLAPILGANGIVLAGIQQFSQIGQIFNPLAAGVFALAGAFAGPFLSSLFESENAADKLEESINALNEIVVTSENGVNALSNEYAALAKKSAAAAQSMLLLAKVNAQDVLIRTADEASNAITEFDTLFNAMEVAATQGAIGKLDEAMQRTGKSVTDLLENTDLYATGLTQLQSATEQLNDKFGITTDKSVEIIRLFEQFKKNRTTETFNNLAEGMARIATEAGDKATPEFIKMVAQVAKLSVEAATAEEKIKLLNEAIAGGKVATEESVKSTEKYSDLLDRLTVRSEKLRSEQLKREKQLTLEKAAEDGVSESMRNSIAAAYDKLIANEQIVESERAKAKAVTEANKKQREEDKRAREADRRQREEERKREKEFRALDKFETVAKSAMTNIEDDPEIQAQIARDAKLEELRKAYMESDLADTQQFVEASKAIWQKYNDDLEVIAEHRVMSTLSSFQSTFDTLAQVFKDAQGEQSTAFRAMFALSKGFAVAQAGLNLSKAISDALAWGGLSLPEKFASVAAISAAGAGFVSSIASATYSGREHGGTVMAGTPYEVGEKNKPELLMIPGNNGKVFSNAEMRSFMNGGSGGGSAPIVNVHNYSGAPVETRTSGGIDEQKIIDIVIGLTSNGNTRVMRNITRLTSATNNAAANRR